jgi:lipid A oxidase
MSRNLRAVALVAAGLSVWSVSARAETQIGVFGGANWNFSSDISGSGVPDHSVDWDGGSGQLPPYWGVRGTYWLGSSPNWGIALEYIHAKAIADLDGPVGADFDRLEFTDGNNLVFLEALYRFTPMMNGTLVPYVGAGIGVTIPHVEVTLAGSSDPTYEYQLAGAAAQIMAGLEYKLNNSWSLFTEAKLSYSHIDADLESGGNLQTELWSPQLAIGVTYRFP